MKLAIMQPYFFPYIGYFSLIKNTDHFVFFDTPQYIRKGWINRNRIIAGGGKDVYITVPVEKAPRDTAIKDIKINNNEKWQEKIRGQLSIYKKRAPYYQDVMAVVEDVINLESDLVSELAIKSVVCSCKYLQIPMKYDVYSQMEHSIADVKEPDEWALYITQQMQYDTYVNPPGGKSFFHREKYEKMGIELQFLIQELQKYNQRTNKFIEGLSILDVMMFCSPNEIESMMEKYVIDRGK